MHTPSLRASFETDVRCHKPISDQICPIMWLSDILCLLTCSLSVQLKDGSYDLLRPIVDNGGRKKCLPTLDFLLTPARALCMPAAHIGLSFAAARDHWYYWERVSSTSAAPL